MESFDLQLWTRIGALNHRTGPRPVPRSQRVAAEHGVESSVDFFVATRCEQGRLAVRRFMESLNDCEIAHCDQEPRASVLDCGSLLPFSDAP